MRVLPSGCLTGRPYTPAIMRIISVLLSYCRTVAEIKGFLVRGTSSRAAGYGQFAAFLFRPILRHAGAHVRVVLAVALLHLRDGAIKRAACAGCGDTDLLAGT